MTLFLLSYSGTLQCLRVKIFAIRPILILQNFYFTKGSPLHGTRLILDEIAKLNHTISLNKISKFSSVKYSCSTGMQNNCCCGCCSHCHCLSMLSSSWPSQWTYTKITTGNASRQCKLKTGRFLQLLYFFSVIE